MGRRSSGLARSVALPTGAFSRGQLSTGLEDPERSGRVLSRRARSRGLAAPAARSRHLARTRAEEWSRDLARTQRRAASAAQAGDLPRRSLPDIGERRSDPVLVLVTDWDRARQI